MELGKKNLICEFCSLEFSSTSTRNRHIRTKHSAPTSASTSAEPVKAERTKRIICPICTNETSFFFYKELIKHLTNSHNLTIKESVLYFRNFEEFTVWRALENREIDFACLTGRKYPNGFVSSAQQRNMKTGGSIRINGTCPSRIIVNISADGSVAINFTETHVGHTDELRTKRLTGAEQTTIVGQLTAGERINLITRGDLAYLIRKFNIDKRRDADDMIATALKIEEWNRQGKNHAFFFKKIGESYPGLNDGDFAIGYMNGIMEKKLRSFSRIICVDGTHGTNKRNLDLTIVLVKDENNMGFPVAFFLSNRLDQLIQQIFFHALQVRLGEPIQAEYIMSDDDPKYYNAWCQVMSTDQKPRRLLCTWHVIKNWNIQGRSKIKKQEVRENMKKEMRKILKETDPLKFIEVKENYFNYLEEEGENDFLKYLQRYYFQNEERIKMWAHCHRRNAGINTNMAIESLNKVLKYNKMKGQRNLRVEKLLDLLEELVDEKMWKTIVNTERPNANNYQHKITLEAHKKAEQMNGKVELLSENDHFKVESCSVSGKYYFVSFNEVCDEECRAGYCTKCKICLHRYRCQCPENAVKTIICKHIHAVALFEQRSESVLGPSTSEEGNVLCIDEPSTSQICYQDDVSHFIQETRPHTTTISFDDQREIMVQEMNSFVRSLDEQSFNEYMVMFRKFKNDNERRNAEKCSKKRKIEKQTYYPSKK
ncbi:hypothetical protein NQ315_008279 [Exocentrus adspersus]|uniref:C2H2-type domain-containing protein n=1 Tax=Exocentrus adspersus TaxID=1586481 RepID=A0AAV8VM23_9CUCU|nr:hypothetical protein NQ315_008279 [Exocentrus adspersus]